VPGEIAEAEVLSPEEKKSKKMISAYNKVMKLTILKKYNLRY